MKKRSPSQSRTGSVYIAVLGTAMVVSVLGMSALVLQRLQNRQLSASSDMRQAQLNAETAIDLGLLTLKTDTTWRTSKTNGSWFTNRATGMGTSSLDVVDPVDANLADDSTEPIVITGVGTSGRATQRVKLTVDSLKAPIGALHSAVAAGNLIDMQGDTLRAIGQVSASQISSSSSTIYGDVKATTITGTTYAGTSAQTAASKLPTLPDWTSVFSYYRTNGTQISINDLPLVTPNLGRNTGIESSTTDWSGTPVYTTVGNCVISQSTAFKRGGTNSLNVTTRDFYYSGPVQYIDTFVKAGAQYNVDVYVYQNVAISRNFWLRLYVKGAGNATPLFDTGPSTAVLIGVSNIGWTKVSATFTVPIWSGNLEYAFIKIGGADSNNTGDFYVDDLMIRENVSGRLIYRAVLSPNSNPFGTGTTNSQGIYWIDCGGNRLIIERSRILGTLLVINPGANSCVSDGPIHWSPAVAGYPALLVDADTATNANFSIRATGRALNEKDNGINYNPSTAPHSDFGQDSDASDIYRSEIQGLIAVRNDLTFQNTPLIRGQVVVGHDISNSSGTLEVDYQPDSLLNPPPGFLGPYTYVRRPGSLTKAVLP